MKNVIFIIRYDLKLILCDFQIRGFQSRFMRLSSSLYLPISSPFNHSSGRYIHSHDTKLHPDYTCGCAFLWKFFCSFFLPRVIPRDFFSSSLPATSTCSSIRYMFRNSFFLFSLFFFLYGFVPFSMRKKSFCIIAMLALNMNYMLYKKKTWSVSGR